MHMRGYLIKLNHLIYVRSLYLDLTLSTFRSKIQTLYFHCTQKNFFPNWHIIKTFYQLRRWKLIQLGTKFLLRKLLFIHQRKMDGEENGNFVYFERYSLYSFHKNRHCTVLTSNFSRSKKLFQHLPQLLFECCWHCWSNIHTSMTQSLR